jgi:hypothetical protein
VAGHGRNENGVAPAGGVGRKTLNPTAAALCRSSRSVRAMRKQRAHEFKSSSLEPSNTVPFLIALDRTPRGPENSVSHEPAAQCKAV